MSGFDTLRRQLRADVRTLRAAQPRRVRWRRRLPLAVALAALSLSAGAFAAVGLLSDGADVEYLRGHAPQPTVGNGTAIPATISDLLRAEDPAGGLPWGLRTYETTRGLACVQVGRVQEDRLGLIGRDGSFGNDGRSPGRLVGEVRLPRAGP